MSGKDYERMLRTYGQLNEDSARLVDRKERHSAMELMSFTHKLPLKCTQCPAELKNWSDVDSHFEKEKGHRPRNCGWEVLGDKTIFQELDVAFRTALAKHRINNQEDQ